MLLNLKIKGIETIGKTGKMEVGSDKNILSILMIKFPEYDYCIRVGKRISLVFRKYKDSRAKWHYDIFNLFLNDSEKDMSVDNIE